MNLKIVDFETAKLLKEVGFDVNTEKCYRLDDCTAYPTKGRKSPFFRLREDKKKEIFDEYCAFAPAQELARKFLRDKHNVSVEIQTPDMVNQGWSYSIHIIESFGAIDDVEGYETYEKALEGGLKQACEYLKDGNK